MSKEVEIQHNLDKLNKALKRLEAISPDVAKKIIKKIAFGIFRDLVKKTPIDTGTARRKWDINPVDNGYGYRISNDTEYLIYLEYGIKGHPLSENPEKRRNSLKYLFASGILQKEDNMVLYFYTPKKTKTEGFIRDTLQEWSQKAKSIIREELINSFKKEFR
ncbi:hypothetical protein LN42_00585 [Marinitoga sp. 1137]|uniref:HK97 gp10 family phage protein n=1 Tax=Marinitoga sp. 1137 TaxID=1545835 RepID=UPI0009504A5F|nr:HK97 gp10 family phage protein [Marinitoga sp. 1137]APT75057.1 hypothetical protein LN42_00585 [Marinitoga sp. 1137]